MKALITIINDYGQVMEKERVIEPVNEFEETNKVGISTKTTVFQFMVKQMYTGERNERPGNDQE